MDDRQIGFAFQMFDATEENDLEFAMVVLREETHVDNDEGEWSACIGILR